MAELYRDIFLEIEEKCPHCHTLTYYKVRFSVINEDTRTCRVCPRCHKAFELYTSLTLFSCTGIAPKDKV